MSEIKSNREIILSDIKEYVTGFISSVVQSNDSIETYPLYTYCFDLLIVHLCGILEQKYRSVSYVRADSDLKGKYELYTSAHNTSVELNRILSDYKNEYSKEIKEIKDLIGRSCKNSTNLSEQHDKYISSITESMFDFYKIKYSKIGFKKVGYKEFKNIVSSINNNSKSNVITDENSMIYNLHSEFKDIFKFLDNIKETYKLDVKLGNMYHCFIGGQFYSIIKKFIDNKDKYYSKIYSRFCETYKQAYDYRHAIAHNIKFGYKVNSLDFYSLSASYSYNIFEYLSTIMIADRVITNIYNHFIMRSM